MWCRAVFPNPVLGESLPAPSKTCNVWVGNHWCIAPYSCSVQLVTHSQEGIPASIPQPSSHPQCLTFLLSVSLPPLSLLLAAGVLTWCCPIIFIYMSWFSEIYSMFISPLLLTDFCRTEPPRRGFCLFLCLFEVIYFFKGAKVDPELGIVSLLASKLNVPVEPL